MKSFLFTLCFLLVAPALRAQDLASNYLAMAGQRPGAHPNAPVRVPVLANPVELATQSVEDAFSADAPSGQAMTQFNGVTLEVQTLPASGTVLVTFSMPAQQSLSVLEVANARTGEVVYSGSLLISNGQVELPVTDVTQPFEVRLSTDRDMIIARMLH